MLKKWKNDIQCLQLKHFFKCCLNFISFASVQVADDIFEAKVSGIMFQ